MSRKNIIPYDWYKRLFSGRSPFGSWNFNDLFREFGKPETKWKEHFMNLSKMLKTDIKRFS